MFASSDPPEHLRPAILESVRWFNQNLRTPFRSKEDIKRSIIWWRAHQAIQAPDRLLEFDPAALSWLKISATEHVSKLYHLKAIMEEAGWLVDEIRTTNAGRVLYEDDFRS